MRLILSGLVGLALLLSCSGEASACSDRSAESLRCNGRLRNGLKAVAKRVVHPFGRCR